MTLLVACGGAPAKPALMAESTDVVVTVSQLRTLDYDFAAHFTTLVTDCANDIIAQSEEDTVRRRALLWKMNAVPAARSAAFHHDPLVALYDLWALTLQQRDHFAEGNGAALFGRHQRCAVAVSRQLCDDVLEVARGVTHTGDVSEIEERLEMWAKMNPIKSGPLVRRSAAADISALTPQAPHKGLQAVESLEETTRDLADRMTILSADLPRESRWQAEYLIHGIFEEHLKEPSRRVVRAFDRVTSLLDSIKEERNAWIDAIGSAGKTLQDSVASERTTLLQSIHEEMTWGFAELEATGRTLIDHVFIRAVQFALILLVIALAGSLVARRRSRDRHRESRDQEDT
ncbi:MAG: hypothetical protein WBG86_07835 [Polyangiales bacterium]